MVLYVVHFVGGFGRCRDLATRIRQRTETEVQEGR
jgi:hypothetical protein